MRASLFTPWGHYYKLLSPVKSFLFIYHHFCSYKLWIIFSFQVFKEAFAYAAFSPFQSNHGVRCGSLCRWERSNDTQLWPEGIRARWSSSDSTLNRLTRESLSAICPLPHTWPHRRRWLASVTVIDRREAVCPSHPDSMAMNDCD